MKEKIKQFFFDLDEDDEKEEGFSIITASLMFAFGMGYLFSLLDISVWGIGGLNTIVTIAGTFAFGTAAIISNHMDIKKKASAEND